MKLVVFTRHANGRPKDVSLTGESKDDSDFIEDIFSNGEGVRVTGWGGTLDEGRNVMLTLHIGEEDEAEIPTPSVSQPS